MPLRYTRNPPRVFGTVKAICPVCGKHAGECEVSMPPVGQQSVTIEAIHAPAGVLDGTLYAQVSFLCRCGIRSSDYAKVVEQPS